MTDTERIDFIERLLQNKDVIHVKENTLKQSQPDMNDVLLEIFTITSQHQYGNSFRELIDKVHEKATA